MRRVWIVVLAVAFTLPLLSCGSSQADLDRARAEGAAAQAEKVKGDAAVGSMISDLRSVANEMETYFVDNQAFPIPTQTGQVVTVGTATVKVSASNTISNVAFGPGVVPGSYCLKAESTNSDDYWYYDSDAGGVATRCS